MNILMTLITVVAAYLFTGWCFARYRQRLFSRVFGRLHRLEQKNARAPEDRHPTAFYYNDWQNTITIRERILAFIFFPMTSGEAMRASQAIISWWRLQKTVSSRSRTRLLLVNLDLPLYRKRGGRINRIAVTIAWPFVFASSALLIPFAIFFYVAPALVERGKELSAKKLFLRSREYLCN